MVARKTFLIVAYLLFGLLGSGCKSLPQKVQELVSQQQFDEAYETLVSGGVQGGTDEGLSPEQVQAKFIYTDSLEAFVSGNRDQSLAAGRAREALEISRSGAVICPWSEIIEEFESQDSYRIALVNEYVAESRLAGDSFLADESLLRKYVDATAYLADSPAAERDASIRFERFTLSVLDDLQSDGVVKGNLRAGIDDICQLTHISQSEVLSIEEAVTLEEALRGDPTYVPDGIYESKVVGRLGSGLEWRRGEPGRSSVSLVNAYLKSTLLSSIKDHTHLILTRGAARDGIEHAESRYVNVEGLDSLIKTQLAKSHIHAAEQRANSGVAAIIALVHLERARELAGETDTWRNTRDKSLQSLATAKVLEEYIYIDVPAGLEPFVQSFLKRFVMENFYERANPLVSWRFVDVHIRDQAAIEIELTDVDLRYAQAELQEKMSRYLSHYQDVENPLKATLKSQIDSQEWSVSSAESSLDFARSSLESEISSHNIYPTEWSLNSVNSARSRYNSARNSYVQAVNIYNSLVNRYNSTPNTISEPVYMPYSYREGLVSHGVALSGQVRVTGRLLPSSSHQEISSRSMDVDNVREGTKVSDVTVSMRRDDPLEIDTSADSLFEHIVKATREFFNDSYGVMGGYLPGDGVPHDLNDWEVEILASRLNPIFDPSKSNASSVPRWAAAHIESIVLPDPSVKIVDEVVMLGASPKAETISGLSDVVPKYGGGLVLIRSGGGSGSGCLISDKGHVLTCAHVIKSSDLQVEFPYIEGSGSYGAKVIYSSQVDDVAILKIDMSPAGARPIPVALDQELSTGETVIAMGNPSLKRKNQEGAAELAVGAVTIGHVAKAAVLNESGSGRSHKLDITIASGSSGGPVIRMRDGMIVGVITHVIREQIGSSYASSGNLALATPAEQLDETLLLRYE